MIQMIRVDIMKLGDEGKFPFELGTAFPSLTSYLTTREKVALAATCQVVRSLLQGPAWHEFSIEDFPKKDLSG